MAGKDSRHGTDPGLWPAVGMDTRQTVRRLYDLVMNLQGGTAGPCGCIVISGSMVWSNRDHDLFGGAMKVGSRFGSAD